MGVGVGVAQRVWILAILPEHYHSGYVEPGDRSISDRMLQEFLEELQLDARKQHVKIVRQGPPLRIDDKNDHANNDKRDDKEEQEEEEHDGDRGRSWLVSPFLVDLLAPEDQIQLDWEHQRYVWTFY